MARVLAYFRNSRSNVRCSKCRETARWPENCGGLSPGDDLAERCSARSQLWPWDLVRPAATTPVGRQVPATTRSPTRIPRPAAATCAADLRLDGPLKVGRVASPCLPRPSARVVMVAARRIRSRRNGHTVPAAAHPPTLCRSAARCPGDHGRRPWPGLRGRRFDRGNPRRSLPRQGPQVSLRQPGNELLTRLPSPERPRGLGPERLLPIRAPTSHAASAASRRRFCQGRSISL